VSFCPPDVFLNRFLSLVSTSTSLISEIDKLKAEHAALLSRAETAEREQDAWKAAFIDRAITGESVCHYCLNNIPGRPCAYGVECDENNLGSMIITRQYCGVPKEVTEK
jgi:hypothetical protein